MTKPALTLLLTLAVIGAALVAARLPAAAVNPQIERVSVTSAGAEGHGPSTQAAVSADGRFVAFASDAPDLVPDNGTNRDIFIHDRLTATTELISVATDGGEANGPSLFPALSADGRYVVYESQADNLVPGDGNGYADIFLRDRQAETTTRVTLAPNGDEANDDSLTPSISASGRYVTYTSQATNLAADDANGERDVFVVDLTTGATQLVSKATDGTQGNFDSGGLGAGAARISADGRYVVFGSFANTLVPNDMNDSDDIFVRDRVNSTTERVSVSTDGVEGNDHSMYGAISDDGRYVVFFSLADTLVAGDHNGAADVFLRDRQTGDTARISRGTGVSEANGASRFPVISGDGRFTAFQSDAGNLVDNDGNSRTDIFLYDMQPAVTQRMSAPSAGGEAHGNSTTAAINGDGSVVAFQSLADDLIPVDDNLTGDVFARGKALAPVPTPTTTRTPTPQATVTPTPTPGRCQASLGDANGDGRVNSIDAALILQFTAGLLPSISPNADANQDGQTNSIDAAVILQFGAGLLTCLPP